MWKTWHCGMVWGIKCLNLHCQNYSLGRGSGVHWKLHSGSCKCYSSQIVMHSVLFQVSFLFSFPNKTPFFIDFQYVYLQSDIPPLSPGGKLNGNENPQSLISPMLSSGYDPHNRDDIPDEPPPLPPRQTTKSASVSTSLFMAGGCMGKAVEGRNHCWDSWGSDKEGWNVSVFQ